MNRLFATWCAHISRPIGRFLLSIVAVLCVTHSVCAQFTRSSDGRIMTTLPTRVMVGSDGSTTVEVVDIGPIDSHRLAALRPTSIPVFSTQSDGRVRAGCTLKNSSTSSQSTIGCTVVDHVQFDPIAGYTARTKGAMLKATSGGNSPPSVFQPGYEQFVPGSDEVPVIYERIAPPVPQTRQSWTIEWVGLEQPDPAFVAAITPALDRTRQRFENLLLENRGNPTIRIAYEPLPQGTIATTLFFYRLISVSQLRTSLLAQANGDNLNGSEEDELDYYANLPATAIPYTYPLITPIELLCQPAGTSTQFVAVPDALLPQLYLPPQGFGPDATITFSTAQPFDYDPTNGVDSSSFDL